MRIKELSTALANQIAAGEVIERPASVVKELIENSLDAGATTIEIDIGKGGQELIRIRDNGRGIHPQDLMLAVTRHATSKVHNFDDLAAIASLGFRGEALASIAAVSRLKIASAQKGMDSGFVIMSEGSELKKPAPIAHPVGTTVEVRDLFFNTPARRKFLRTEKTEFNHIETMVRRLALSRFDVAFILKHNQREVFNTKSARTATLQQARVAEVLGKSFMQDALGIEFAASGMRLTGWIALPNYTRSQADMQYFYINGRFVRDKLLMHAARQAYHDVLFHGRHPAYVLSLGIDPELVDVNVHPTKHEVRFRESQTVHEFLRRGIKDALKQVRPNEEPVSQTEILELQPEPISQQQELIGRPVSDDSGVSSGYPVQKLPDDNRNDSSPVSYLNNINKSAIKTQAQQQMHAYAKMHERCEAVDDVDYSQDNITTPPLGFALAQLHNIYILAENKQGLVLVDMHAAHERILYEKLKTQLNTQGISRQMLLVPIMIDLHNSDLQIWEDYRDALNQIGIMSESVGPNSVAVREVPVLIQSNNIEQLVRDVLADITSNQSSSRVKQTIEAILGNIACRASVRAHHELNISEMNALLRSMEQTDNSGFCNHGRPTWVQFNHKELDRFFLRGQ